MFTFPKKLPPRHKKKKRRKKLSLDDLSSDDDVLKEKSNNKNQTVTSSMGFGKDIKGTFMHTQQNSPELIFLISVMKKYSVTELKALQERVAGIYDKNLRRNLSDFEEEIVIPEAAVCVMASLKQL